MTHPTPKPDRHPNRGPNRDWVRNLGMFSVIISDLVGYTGIGVGIGYLAWKKWNAPWWVLLLSSLTGLALAMVRVYQVSQKASQD